MEEGHISLSRLTAAARSQASAARTIAFHASVARTRRRAKSMSCTSDKRCEFDGCEKEPTFGSLDDRVKRFCTTHQQKGHANLKAKRCKADGSEGSHLWQDVHVGASARRTSG
jgi:hypothetical protein